MYTLVGQEASFDHGREQMKLLAGLEVTAKSVERGAETIGADIARRAEKKVIIGDGAEWICSLARQPERLDRAPSETLAR